MKHPTSDADLLETVYADVHANNPQSGIQNVLTTPLYFWYGHAARHFDLDYGYNRTSGPIYVAEEWKHPVDAAGDVPYGHRTSKLVYDRDAIDQSTSTDLIW